MNNFKSAPLLLMPFVSQEVPALLYGIVWAQLRFIAGINSHTHTCTHTHTCIMYIHNHTHTYTTHTHTQHTHTHTHTHTQHTHTCTDSSIPYSSFIITYHSPPPVALTQLQVPPSLPPSYQSSWLLKLSISLGLLCTVRSPSFLGSSWISPQCHIVPICVQYVTSSGNKTGNETGNKPGNISTIKHNCEYCSCTPLDDISTFGLFDIIVLRVNPP